MRCIAALILLFAAATNALAPVASMATQTKKAKKRSTHKNKSPPKLALERPRKKTERLGMVELDDATLARVEALFEDSTTFGLQCPRPRGCLQLSGSLALPSTPWTQRWPLDSLDSPAVPPAAHDLQPQQQVRPQHRAGVQEEAHGPRV